MAGTPRDRKLQEAKAEDREEDHMSRVKRNSREKREQRPGNGPGLLRRLLRRILP